MTRKGNDGRTPIEKMRDRAAILCGATAGLGVASMMISHSPDNIVAVIAILAPVAGLSGLVWLICAIIVEAKKS